MSELDLLNLGRSITANDVSWFAQVITINLAMVVGIFYFLNGAQLAMKVFAYVAYLVGMMLYLGEMLVEANVKAMVLQSLSALPSQSAVTQEYLAINASWIGVLTRVLFNGAFWILTLGIFYLLFFWKKDREEV